jgi:hypothetical protein
MSTQTELQPSRTKEIIFAVVVVILFAVSMYYALSVFSRENEKEPVVKLDNDYTKPDYILLNMQVVSIDPLKGDLVVRVNADPEGVYDEDQLTLSQDITIYTNSNSGKNEFQFKKGNRISPFEISLDMYDGSIMEYPYDDHMADLSISVVSQEKDSAGNIETTDVPLMKEVHFYSSLAGYKVTEVKETEGGDGYSDMEFTIERTTSVLMFSTFVMILMWCMTITIILVVSSIVIRKRKVEYSMFAFLSAMIFALPALRNMQPFVPTIGCYSDYLAFFWAEATIAAGLVILIATWLKRPSPKQV